MNEKTNEDLTKAANVQAKASMDERTSYEANKLRNKRTDEETYARNSEQ